MILGTCDVPVVPDGDAIRAGITPVQPWYNPGITLVQPNSQWGLYPPPQKVSLKWAHLPGRWVFLFAVHAAEEGVKGDERKKRGEGEGRR